MHFIVALLAAQSPEALDLLDRMDAMPIGDVALVELPAEEAGPAALAALLLDVDDLSFQLPYRKRAFGVVARWREAWQVDGALHRQAFELVLTVDLGAFFYPTAAALGLPPAEHERRQRCQSLAASVGGPLERAYRSAAFSALACEVGS